MAGQRASVRCIAHRGFAGVNPENTVPAVEGAVAAGADVVEVDVRRCGSGEVVVCHDATVDRVSDGSGAVADHSRDELAALDVLNSGAGVPTLAAVLDALPPGVGLNVEFKERGLAADVLATAERYPADLLLSSFDEAALGEAAEVDPDAPLALLVGDGEADPQVESDAGVRSDVDALTAATELGCAAVHPHHARCDAAFVADAHDRGLRVNAWTVREPDTASRLRQVGVDGCIADDPACCLTG